MKQWYSQDPCFWKGMLEFLHVCACMCVLSHVSLLAIPWTVTRQAPLSMEFSSQEYWRG